LFPYVQFPLLPFSKRFRNRQSHAGASWLINSIERPYPFLLNTAERLVERFDPDEFRVREDGINE
jgi:hypothetical protein